VANARARGIEIHAVIFRKALDGLILVQIGILFVLDVVVEGKDQLFGILDLLRADGLKLLHHSRGIVMRHHAMRADGNKVPSPQRPFRPLSQMRLRDFFNDGLTHKHPWSLLHVILSGVSASLREADTKSKDPYHLIMARLYRRSPLDPRKFRENKTSASPVSFAHSGLIRFPSYPGLTPRGYTLDAAPRLGM
jgi:hypothetical protein